jgi:predicted alpha/beta-fold hydrolase
MIILCNYLKSNTTNEELQNVYISVNYLSILNIGYFIISVISQVYRLYFIKNNKQVINNIVVNECNKSKKNKKKIKNKKSLESLKK